MNQSNSVNHSYKYSDVTSKIIACAIQVHSHLGNGFPEKFYQSALAIEMSKSNLSFHREMEMPVYYFKQLIGKRRVDFFVENKICALYRKALGVFMRKDTQQK